MNEPLCPHEKSGSHLAARPSLCAPPLLVLVIVLILSASALGACTVTIGDTVRGSGNVLSEDRPVGGITGVALTTVGDLTIEMGDQESLRIEAEDNLLQYFQTTVSGGVLTIETEPGVSISSRKPVRYYLTVKTLESIRTSSSGNVSATALDTGNLTIEITSSGEVELASVEAASLEVRLSSSGNLSIGGGQIAAQQVKLSSSGDYEAGGLRSSSATVDLSSSGSATIWVTDGLEANLSSSGNLKYYGSPSVDVNASSSGEAKNLGDK
jgi:hypothetical protein